MEKFIRWTAWTMQTPKAYGAFHLTFSIVGMVVVVLTAWFLRKLNNKQNRILLLCIGLFLALFEVYKLLFYYFVIGGGRFVWWVFPFQLCSVPMYLCIFCGLCKIEKVNNWMYEFVFSFSFLTGVLPLFEPSGINHPYVMLTLHAYTWHLILAFLGLYLFFSKRAGNSKGGYLKGATVFLGAVVVAQIINVCLRGRDGATMFFISPYAGTGMIIMKDIYAKFGWVANMFAYIIAMLAMSAVVYYLFYWCRILHQKRIKKKVKDA